MTRRTLIGLLLVAAGLILGVTCELRSRKDRDQGRLGRDTANGRPGDSSFRTGSSNAPHTSLGTVSGVVRDTFTRKAVPHIDVIFSTGGMEATATSDVRGYYEIELPSGQYGQRAIGDGWLGLSQPSVEVAGAARVTTFDVEVLSLVALEGRVVDEHGNGVEAAHVTFNSYVAPQRITSRDLEPEGTSETGSDGRFAMRIVPGDVSLDAMTVDGKRGRAFVRSVEATGSYKNIEILLDAGGGVSGRVFTPDGNPVAGARVHASSASRATRLSEQATLVTDDDGAFKLDHIVSGRLVLEASAAGYAASAPNVSVLAPSQRLADIELTLRPSLALEGVVLDSEGVPLGGVQVIARRPRPGFPSGSEHSVTDSDGEFSIAGLGADSYELVARKGGYAPVFLKGVKPPQDRIEIRLLATGGIEGIITDEQGRPIGDFRLRVESWTPATSDLRRPGALGSQRFLRKDGSFSLPTADAGTYDLLITAPGFAPGRRKAVEVHADKTSDGSLSLKRSGSVNGTVSSSATGEPVVAAHVTVESGYEGHSVRTNGEGRFTLVDVAAGQRSVTVAHKEYITRSESGISVRPGGIESVNIRLTPAEGSQKNSGSIEVSGIGAVLSRQPDRLLVASVLENGPADLAGVLRADRIVTIDGVSTRPMSRADAVEAVRGPAGTTVVLEIVRGTDQLRFAIVRGNIRYPGARRVRQGLDRPAILIK